MRLSGRAFADLFVRLARKPHAGQQSFSPSTWEHAAWRLAVSSGELVRQRYAEAVLALMGEAGGLPGWQSAGQRQQIASRKTGCRFAVVTGRP
jgi:hypothetical protein